MNIPIEIKTDRIILRKMEQRDLKALREAATETHESLYKWYGGALTKKDISDTELSTYIDECRAEFDVGSFIQYCAFTHDNALIGIGSLHHMDWSVPKGRIGYWVRQSQVGKGYATEIAHILTRLAFERLALKRLEIRAATKNPASGAIARKLDYQFLTIFEKNKVGNDGMLWDLEIYVRFDTECLPPMNIVYE